MVKKGFVRTLEAAVAIIMTLSFIIVVIASETPPSVKESQVILPYLNQDPYFRDCVVASNSSCLNSRFKNRLRNQFDFVYDISTDPNSIPSLPEKDILTDSYFIAGNASIYSGKIIKLYYWKR